MNMISIDKVKELLGITSTEYDAQIDRYIPVIETKVKMITGNNYNMVIKGNITNGSDIAEVYGKNNTTGGIGNHYTMDNIGNYLDPGSLVEGEGIAAGAYIKTVYNNGGNININGIDYMIPCIKMSDPATVDGYVDITVGIPIGLQHVLAKGIIWLIDQENTDEPGLGWTSRRIGSVGVVRGVDQAKIDGKYGMPVWFVNALPRYMRGL